MRPTWGRSEGYGRSPYFPFSLYSIPVTRALLIAAGVLFLASFSPLGPALSQWLVFGADGRRLASWLLEPWTWFSYPLYSGPDLWVFLNLYLLYQYGGSLERSWGSPNFLALFFAFSAIGAIGIGLGSYALDERVGIGGMYVTLASLVAAWAALDPDLMVSFFGAPIKAKIVGIFFVALMLYRFGFPLGVFALAGPLAAVFYVRKMPRLNLSFPGQRPDRWAPDLRDTPREPPRRETPRESVGGFNPLRRRQEQAEMERLRKLLGEDDDDRPRTRN